MNLGWKVRWVLETFLKPTALLFWVIFLFSPNSDKAFDLFRYVTTYDP